MDGHGNLDPVAAAELFPAASPGASKLKHPSRAYSGRRRHSAMVSLGRPELRPGGLRTSEVPGIRTAGEERRELMRCAMSFSPFFSSLVCVATCSLLAPVDPYQVTVSCLSSAGDLGFPRPGIGARRPSRPCVLLPGTMALGTNHV
jgi:hypothetical protein